LFDASNSRFEQVNELILDMLDANYKNQVSADFYKAWDDFVMVRLLDCSNDYLQAGPTVLQNCQGARFNLGCNNFFSGHLAIPKRSFDPCP
jgi:hypothetical protein